MAATATTAAKPVMYWNKLCPFVHRSWIVAVEKGATDIHYEHISLGDDKPEWYTKEINPRGTVPAFKNAAGKILHESLPIAEYLDATYGPKYALAGNDPVIRAKISAFNSQIGDLIGSMYGFLINNTDEKRKDVIEHLKWGEELFNTHTKEGPFFLGKTFSMADITIVPFFIRFASTLKAYNDFDLAKEAPWADALRRASLERHSVASTTLSPEFYIDVYTHYAKRESKYPKAKLYVSAACPFAQRTRIAAGFKGLIGKHIEEVVLPLPLPESYTKDVNPAGTVPALVTPTGELIQESNVIVEYINNAYKGVGDDLIPEDEDRVCEAKLLISEYSGFQSGAFQFFGPAPGEEKDKKLAAFKEDGKYIENMINELSKEGPWILGDKFSFVDAITLPMLFRIDAVSSDVRLSNGYDFFAEHPRLAALLAAGKANSAIAATVAPNEVYIKGIKGYFGIE